jgi:hypothetical protein
VRDTFGVEALRTAASVYDVDEVFQSQLKFTPRCDDYQGRRSVNLVEAVYQSTRTGQPVDVQQS